MKHTNRFLYVQNMKQEWSLVLPGTFNVKGKNFLEIVIMDSHAATAHGRIEKTMNALTDKVECQSFSQLVKKYVASCDIYQGTKYSQRGPIQYITSLLVAVRLLSDITMDCLKVAAVFTKCSVKYPNILAGEEHIVGISRLWMIVDRQLGFMFLIHVSDNLTAEQYRATFDTHVVPTMGYSYCIVFDQDTHFMSLHFQSWAAGKGIKLEPSTTYHP